LISPLPQSFRTKKKKIGALRSPEDIDDLNYTMAINQYRINKDEE
jgi:hypothetical protein